MRALYELAKWGPTTANSQPQRVVFVRSAEAKARLAPALSSQNKKKALGAPVVAILAYDMRFYEHLPRLFHNPQARSWYETTPEAIRTTALRNATLQGAYLMLAARAIGLDCGPMSGFKNDVVDAAFFPDGRFKSNFLCCLGHGDPSTLPPQDYPLRLRRGVQNPLSWRQARPYTGTTPPRVTAFSGDARNRIVAATSSTFGQAAIVCVRASTCGWPACPWSRAPPR